MSRIIIGIHGLGNKPQQKTLRAWWKASIGEGMKAFAKSKRSYNFELVYWAQYFNPLPLQPRVKDKDHPLYIEDPYYKAPKGAEVKAPGDFRQKVLDYVDAKLDKLFLNDDLTINYTSITDFIIRHFFKDLEAYYGNDYVNKPGAQCRVKEVICSYLANVLKKHRQKKILLIAHSMGSIIAYDVLTQYARDVNIDTLVTIGSPLGLPIIQSKLMVDAGREHSQKGLLKTPENILNHWYNLSDLRDKIAIDYKLADDFEANSRQVRPEDKIVVNNYEFMGAKNPHKVFGYLRTAEMAWIIDAYLGAGKFDPFIWLGKIMPFKWNRNVAF